MAGRRGRILLLGGGGVPNNPTLTGVVTMAGAHVIPTYVITGNVVETVKRCGVLSLTGNVTLTFDANPPAANSRFEALLHADGTDRTVTIPSSKSFLRGTTITSFVVPANGSVLVVWYYTGSTLHIYGDPMTPAQVKSALAINFTDLAGTIALGQVPSGSALQVFRRNAANDGLEFAAAGVGTGDVVGPASATDDGLAVFDGTTGKLIQVATGWSVVNGELIASADGNPGYLILKDGHATAPKQLVSTAPTALTTDQVYVEPATGGTVGQVKRVASVTGDVRVMEWATPAYPVPAVAAGSAALTFTAAPQRLTQTFTGNVTYTGSGYADGRQITMFLTADSVDRTVAFPSGWVFVGTKPTSFVASKKAVFTLECIGPNEADVRCEWSVSP